MPKHYDLDNVLLDNAIGSRIRRLEHQYGPTLFLQAQVDTMIGLMIVNGIIKRDQFLDLVEQMLAMRDLERKREAGLI